MPADSPFILRQPRGVKRSVLVSAPHVGTEFPSDLRSLFDPQALKTLRDTDWCVHDLYEFCTEAGFTLVHARYHRYVIDLNRPAAGPALYSDTRRQTDILPMTDFDGQPLYAKGKEPTAADRQDRIMRFYQPYYELIEQLLSDLQVDRRQVVLLDAHSIRRVVPSIDPLPFPDLILGDRDGTSAANAVSSALRAVFEASPYQLRYNKPFKGGQITRFFGQAPQGRHAVQLEMSQDLYLYSDRPQLDPEKSTRLQSWLLQGLEALDTAVRTLP